MVMKPVLWGVLVGFLLLALCARGHSHDHKRPELNDWFNGLHSGRGNCCSNADGTALSDVDWESKDGQYRVRIDNQWYDVPQDAVLDVPNRAGVTMVWPLRIYRYIGKPEIMIRCFIPGSMT